MQPVIEVQCPFCKARGQIVTPPVGSIIVGPCPRCSELVLLFCGAVLPLEKDVILHGTSDEKKTHLIETIMDLVENRIDELVDNAETNANDGDGEGEGIMEEPGEFDEAEPVEAEEQAEEPLPEPREFLPRLPLRRPSTLSGTPSSEISDEEVRDFLDIDLHLIDRKEHFDKVFGRS